MANTYTQLHIQFVFVVKFRENQIDQSWKVELYKYISGIIAANNHKLLAINGMPDHLHIFISMKPHQAMSDLCQIIKANSSKWINERGFTKSKFQWLIGFGAFSYSLSHVPRVINYVLNQEIHHAKKTFQTEYKELLAEQEIEYNDDYLFHDPI